MQSVSWVTVIWSMSAAVSLTMGAIHFVVWLQDRKAWANLCFSCAALSVAAFAVLELILMRAQTVAQFAVMHRWMHVPLFFTCVSLVGFITFYFRSGRLNNQIAVYLGRIEKTVKVHRARVMSKMGARSVAELVYLAARVGIAMDPTPRLSPAISAGRTELSFHGLRTDLRYTANLPAAIGLRENARTVQYAI